MWNLEVQTRPVASNCHGKIPSTSTALLASGNLGFSLNHTWGCTLPARLAAPCTEQTGVGARVTLHATTNADPQDAGNCHKQGTGFGTTRFWETGTG